MCYHIFSRCEIVKARFEQNLIWKRDKACWQQLTVRAAEIAAALAAVFFARASAGRFRR